MRKNILFAFLFVFLSFTLISCGNGNLVDETASNTTPDASLKELLSISAVSQGGTTYKFTPNVYGASLAELTYKWTFGDGNESTEQSPVHPYTKYGPKTVTLTTYKGEEIWKTTSTAINVTDAGSITNLDLIATPADDGINYTFTSRAIAADGGDLEFTWSFDDGGVNDQKGTNLNNVTHAFTQYDRVYNVTLTVTNPNNGDTASTKVTVNTPTPTFTFDVTAGALPGSKVFIPNLSVNIPDVTYTWIFDTDNASMTATSSNENPNTEYHYGSYSKNAVNVKCTATSPNLAKDLVFVVEDVNVTINFQLFGASYEVTSDDQLSYTYNVKGAYQGEDATGINNVSYKFYYADGTSSNKIAGQPVMDGETAVAGQTQATDNHTYSKYYQNYVVRVEAIQTDSGTILGSLSDGLSHRFVAPRYTISTSVDDSNPFAVTYSVGGEGFYPLKGAVYAWNPGDNTGEIQGQTTNHTYTSNGTFNITLRVDTTLIDFENAYVTRSTVNINESLSNVRIQCSGTTVDTWLTYNCSTPATSSTGTLEYIWKIDGQVVPNNNKATLQPVFTKYNKSHNIDLTVRIAGTNISVDAERWVINTPVASLEMEGSQSVFSGVSSNYTLKLKITRGSESKYIDVKNPNVIWKFNDYHNTPYDNKMSISHAFTVNTETEGNTVVRRVYNEVRGDNINDVVTKTTNITVTKPDPGMSDIENVRIVCENDSAWNPVKKKCYVDFNFKAGVRNPDSSKFRATIKDTGNLNKAQEIGLGRDNKTALVLEWPLLNITGKPSSRDFTLTASVYKAGNPSNSTTVTKIATVSNYIDYVLFPLPDNPTQGGTGTQIGVYSCGYNSFYSTGQGQIERQGCNEGNSVSGKTLNLGPLLNGNNQAQVQFRMKWGARIPNVGNVNIISRTINANGSVPPEMKKFNFGNAFGSHKYAGDAYGNDNNGIFYLEITDAVSKPLKVWYNGNYKTDKGNRLRILAPIQETSGHSCSYSFSGNTVYGDQLYVKFRQPYFNNGSGNFNLWFAGDLYVGSTNQYRSFGGGGFPSINSSNQTVGIKNLWYNEGDDTVKINSVRNVTISVTLQNSMSGGTWEYKNVYKGITCNN